jgi:hypothetical protein
MQIQLREFRAIALMVGILLVYSLSVLSTGKVPLAEFDRLFGRYLGTVSALTIITTVIAFFYLLFRNIFFRKPEESRSFLRSVGSWFVGRWKRDGFLSFFWPPLLFAILMASFNSFKQLVLGPVPFKYDALLAQWDKALFFGNDPWTITHAILSEPWMTNAIDFFYHSWFLPMSIGVIICAYLPNSTFRLRTQYLLTYLGVWIFIGSFLAYLFPSAGPCFYNDFVGQSDSFAQLMSRLQNASGEFEKGSFGFLVGQDHLRQTYGATNLTIGGGISAMPSVHNALAVLFAIAAFEVNRKAGWVMIGYAILIWIGSIHLGWHYAVDGIVAAIATLGLWHGAGTLVDLIDRQPQQKTAAALVQDHT